jgi:hypothetical protein
MNDILIDLHNAFMTLERMKSSVVEAEAVYKHATSAVCAELCPVHIQVGDIFALYVGDWKLLAHKVGEKEFEATWLQKSE